MARRSNREIEEECFRQFCAHFPLPPGEVVHQDKPDVIISGPRKIGVEIARLYLADGSDPHSEQLQRPRRETVIREAQAQYLRSGGERVITASFNPSYPIEDASVTAGRLADLVASIHIGGPVPKSLLSGVPEVRSLYFHSNEDPKNSWRMLSEFMVPCLSVPRVVSVVAEKDRLLAGYEQCDSYWLLLIVDWMDGAQDQHIDWPEGAPVLRTNFERVFVYKPDFADWTEAPCRREGLMLGRPRAAQAYRTGSRAPP